MTTNGNQQGAVQVVATPVIHTSLVVKIAQRFNVEPQKMLSTLKATAFRTSKEVTNEQMMALLIVSDQYQLNPFTRELYAFPDERGGITPVVSIDGWDRIINSHPQVEDGPNFRESEDMLDHEGKKVPAWIECTIKRRDRRSPTIIRERFKECVRATGPWKSHPCRMLRHKAMIQCARIALGFSGIYDFDEAERITEAQVNAPTELPPVLAALNAPETPAPAPTAAEDAAGEVVEAAGLGAEVEPSEIDEFRQQMDAADNS